MTDDEFNEMVMDKVAEIVQSPAMQPMFFKNAKDACEHVLLQFVIVATHPEHVVDFQKDVHHMRNARLNYALTTQRMTELEIWQKKHDATCIKLEENRNEAISRIEAELVNGKNARKWI